MFSIAIPLTSKSNSPNAEFFYYFCYVFSFIHFVIGISVILKFKVGYKCLKFYLLYILKLGYPIGSIIADKMLKYMYENNIEGYFKEQ